MEHNRKIAIDFFTLMGILQIVLIVIKILEVSSLSWFWTFVPTMIYFGFTTLVISLFIVVYLYAKVKYRPRKFRKRK